jgi:dolichyl-diphosphooligosaccharide--protein glycosyltransferase
MIRIAAGVFPQIKEQNYYANGRYKIDKDVSPGMKNCLMYRLVYYRFSEMANRRAQS